MTITEREAMVLAACAELEGSWHQHYLSEVARRIGPVMTECEFAALFDELARKGCVVCEGNLMYGMTPLGRRFARAWKERGKA